MIYRLVNSLDKKVIGYYGQTEDPPDGYSYTELYEGENSMSNLNYEKFPEQDPKLVFQLMPKAKLTDVVETGRIPTPGFLLNNKVKELIESVDILKHQFYPAQLITKQGTLDYFWFHMVNETGLEGVDFVASSFYQSDYVNKIRDLTVNSIEDYKRISKEIQGDINEVSCEKMVLTKSFEKYDLFTIPLISWYVFATEKFKKLCDEHGVVGFEFEQQELIK